MLTLQFPLPLLLAAAVHGSIIALTVAKPAYCSTPLLAHPLSARRLHALAVVMHTSTFSGHALGHRAGPAGCVRLRRRAELPAGHGGGAAHRAAGLAGSDA